MWPSPRTEPSVSWRLNNRNNSVVPERGQPIMKMGSLGGSSVPRTIVIARLPARDDNGPGYRGASQRSHLHNRLSSFGHDTVVSIVEPPRDTRLRAGRGPHLLEHLSAPEALWMVVRPGD